MKDKNGGKNKKAKGALRKNILREIWKTKSRFISIFAIIGISVGFFAGLKSVLPSMLKTAQEYFSDNHLMDIRLMSTVGFDDEDIAEISKLDCVEEVMPGYMSDLLVKQGGNDFAVRVYSAPEKTDTNSVLINEPMIVDGRLPTKEGECAIENYYLKMSGYKIGDTLSIEPKVEKRDTTEYVKHLEYKIVGVIDCPMYLTYQRGNTNIGDGSITYYMMLPSDEFAMERYTAVYVRTKASSAGVSDFSDEYKDMVDDQKSEFEDISYSCIDRFNSTTLSDAQKELADARKEYEDGKKEALDKISDGEKKLSDGESEFYEKIAEAQKKLDDGEKELADAKEKLTDGQEEYKTGIETAKQKLTDAQNEYADGLTKYNSAKAEYDTKIDEAEKKLNSAQTEFNTQYQIFYGSTKPQAETKLSLLKSAIDICNEGIEKTQQRLDELNVGITIEADGQTEMQPLQDKLDEYRTKLNEYQQQYDEGMKLLSEGEEQLNAAKTALEDAQTEFQTQKTDGALQLSAAKTQLDNAQIQLDIAKLEYDTAMTTGMFDMQSAQSKITDGEKELSDGRAELEKQKLIGMQTLKESREKLAVGKYEAHVKLTDAEKQLRDAEDTIELLENAEWYVYDRDDNPGYSGLVEDANRVDSIANVFPAFFLLVAALVCFTTMTRMVEERRTETGTLKALGYSNSAIAMKYFVYSAAAAALGSVAGSALGVLTLPYIIVMTYGIMYILPATVLVINWEIVIVSSVVAVICISIVSFAACFRDLRIAPATLMRPKAPKPGKRIFLEYIRPLWGHLNFTSKVTARNLFRYKARFFMTVIGVAGCTALVIAGFGLRDSITGIADKQFVQISSYDQIYALSEEGTADDKAYIMSQFRRDDRFDVSLLSTMDVTELTTPKSSKTLTARTIVAEDMDAFKKIFVLRDRESHEGYELSDDGIIINERMGMVFNVGVGDSIDIKMNEKTYTCKITALTENYASNFIYMTPGYYRNMTGKEAKYGIVFTKLTEENKDAEHDIANEYMKNDDIVTVSSVSDSVNTILDMLDSLNAIVFVVILCAGLLAVVVLYNLTNINIAERVREIATIKVLGFYELETANFIYREGIVLTVLGAFAGLFLGNIFLTFVIESIQMDNVMFPKEISWLTYLLGFVMTLLFSLLVNFLMYFKMNKISMVESLKSIE